MLLKTAFWTHIVKKKNVTYSKLCYLQTILSSIFQRIITLGKLVQYDKINRAYKFFSFHFVLYVCAEIGFHLSTIPDSWKRNLF